MAKVRIKNYAQGTSEINILKDIRTDLSVTPSTYTPDTFTVTRDRLVTFAQAEEELVVLGDIEKGVKQQVVKGDIADKRITNIEKLLQGNLYDYQTDNSSAYTKSVPSGAMPYAGIEKLGGKTIVMNQLCGAKALTGIVTYNGDGTYIFNGTQNNTGYSTLSNIQTIVGHKYFASIYTSVGDNGNIQLYNDNGGILVDSSTSGYASVIGTASASKYVFFRIAVGTYNNMKVKARFIDLTLAFGSGNEPSTVAEVEALFPSYYEYNAGTLLSAGVTSVVSKKADTTTLATYSIPAEVQALEGYGWSAGSVYNYVDFERKVFVKNVARVDLGGLSWTYNTSGTEPIFSTTVSDSKPAPTSSSPGHIICPIYTVIGSTNIAKTGYDKCIAKGSGVNNHSVHVQNSSYTDATTFKTAMNGVYLYYELATPQEIDISEYLTDDNLIQVESGGTLTFPNSNGTDYQIPVPSEEEYMIDLQSTL